MATPIPPNQARFTAAELMRACGGTLRGASAGASAGPQLEVVGVSTDSRTVAPGNLYVALRGESHDGHRFVTKALASGAAMLLVSDPAALPPGAPALVVDDTLRALGDLAAAHRHRWGGRAIGVTGSAGKTTTKELIFAGLAAAGARAAKTAGNLNNLVGLPMTLLALDESVELAVLELGTSAPGEIARLSEIAAPEIGLVTAVAAAHTQGLGGLSGVAREKSDLLRALPATGTAIYHADNPALVAQLDEVVAQKVGFGRAPQATARLTSYALGSSDAGRPVAHCGLTFGDSGRRLALELALFGEGPAIDAVAALAAVRAAMGEGALERAAEGLSALAPSAGRLCPAPAPRGALTLDDSYNANPASMRASIETACELARVRGGRALLVLADMLELGDESAAQHAEVGRLSAAPQVALLVACGPHMQEAARAAALERPDLTVVVRDDAGGAERDLLPRLQAGDVVLVKGSRSMRTERVVDALREASA